MKPYLENIYNIYKSYLGKDDFYPGPRFTGIDNKNVTYLILGINPCNSFRI